MKRNHDGSRVPRRSQRSYNTRAKIILQEMMMFDETPQSFARLGDLSDRQQSAWQRGERLLVETLVADVSPALGDSELLELIYAEVRLRAERGEVVPAEEFLQRFPQFALFLRRLFANREVREGARPAKAHIACDLGEPIGSPDALPSQEIRVGPQYAGPSYSADRSQLLAILALQMGFIDRDELVDALLDWSKQKGQPLGQILVERGELSAARRELLDPLVDEQLRLYDDAPAPGCGAISSFGEGTFDWHRVCDFDIAENLAVQDLIRNAAELSDRSRRPDDMSASDSMRYSTIAPVGSQIIATDDMSASDSMRYRVLRPHARGGIGEVFLAFDGELNREVALKEIQTRHSRNDSYRERFVREAEVTGGLEHPGIVPVYSLGHHGDGRPFYAMRFIRGDSLKEAIEKFHSVSTASVADTRQDAASTPTQLGSTPAEIPARSIPAQVRRGVLRQDFESVEFRKLLGRFIDVCLAIEYAHSRGVLHRDLKPGNIMLGKYGETLVVDWGLAKAAGKEERFANVDEVTLVPSSGSGTEQTVDGSVIGTPAYMSPEQASGRVEELGPATDIYSLGATLYHMLSGDSPFESLPLLELLGRVKQGRFLRPHEVNSHIPPALEAICLKAMSLHPGDRYQSAAGLAEDLEHWLADEPVSACRETVILVASRWIRRHRAWALSGTAAMALIAGIAIFAAVWINAERRATDRERLNAIQAQAEEARQHRIAQVERRDAMNARQKAEKAYKDAEASRMAAVVDRRKAEAAELKTQRLLGEKRVALDAAISAKSNEEREKKIAIEKSKDAMIAQQEAEEARKSAVLAKDMAVAAEMELLAALKREQEERRTAVTAQKKAEVAVADRERTMAELRRHHDIALYALDLSEVQGLIQKRNLEFAQRILVEVPIEHRGWEWAYMAKQSGLESAIQATLKPPAKGMAPVRQEQNGLQNQRQLVGHSAPVYAVAFSPDQKLMASAGGDKQICIWKTSDWTLVQRLNGHNREIRALTFIPGQGHLASGSTDQTVRIWDVTSGREVKQLKLDELQFFSLTASPDGQFLFAGCGFPNGENPAPQNIEEFSKWGGGQCAGTLPTTTRTSTL